MKTLANKSGLSWLWLTLLVLAFDQVTKHWVASTMDLFESIAVLPFFSITYVHNLGAAFSFLAEQSGWQRWLFSLISLTASIFFFIWLKRTDKKHTWLSIAIALLLSGAVGNLIDRALLGYVIDFLDFYLGNNHWPAFNIADSAIFIGAVMLIIDSIKNGEQHNNKDVDTVS